MKKPFLKYIGDGSFLPGVPVRDLSESEVKVYGLEGLLASGLYEEIKSAPVKQPDKEAQCQELEN